MMRFARCSGLLFMCFMLDRGSTSTMPRWERCNRRR
jgi:hypothetical protein